MFETSIELEEHMLAGKHMTQEILSSTDVINSVYRHRASNEFEQFRMVPDQATSSTAPAINVFQKGWALPVRRGGRLNVDAKEFIFEKFKEGEVTGKKYSPHQLANLIRNEIDPSNPAQKRFNKEQYLQPHQIKSLLARYSKILAQKSDVKISEIIEVLPQVRFI